MTKSNLHIMKLKIESLKFEGLDFGYEGHDLIFSGVDFEFPLDQTIWIKASSGAGRSSLLQILAGLQIPTKGKYIINDKDVTQMSFEEFLPYRLNIGYAFDYGGLINNRTLEENCLLPLTYHNLCSERDARDRVQELFDKFGVVKYKAQRPAHVPGGIRRLICLLRAIVAEPEMLLLDDPTVGLSQEISLRYFDHVQSLRNSGKVKHVFVSSFDDKILNLVPHEEIFIDEGLLHSASPNEAKKVVHL